MRSFIAALPPSLPAPPELFHHPGQYYSHQGFVPLVKYTTTWLTELQLNLSLSSASVAESSGPQSRSLRKLSLLLALNFLRPNIHNPSSMAIVSMSVDSSVSEMKGRNPTTSCSLVKRLARDKLPKTLEVSMVPQGEHDDLRPDQNKLVSALQDV